MPITQDDLHNVVPEHIAKLRPCPFCGSDKMGFSYKRFPYRLPPQYRVRFRCKSCHCGTGKSVDMDKLVTLWNSAKR
jgi:hypothetical protein